MREIFRGSAFLRQRWIWLAYLLLSLYLILILCTFLDYGIGWDEYWHATYGEYVIKWYTSHFRDRAAINYWTLKWYGGFAQVIEQLATRISPLGTFETRHLVNALFGMFGVVGAYKLGKYLGGPLAGFLSALFLSLTPRFYGHSFTNSTDIPFAALFLFSTYYIIKSVRFLPRLPRGLILKLGLAIGLTVGIRIGGVILLGYLGLAFCLWLMGQYLLKYKHSSEAISFRSAFTTFGKSYLAVCVIAYVVMLVWWPSAQAEPVMHPLKALWKASHFPWTREVFFEGRFVPAGDIPWYYIPKWILITLPEFYFVGLAVGLVLLGLAIARSNRIRSYDRFAEYSVLLFSILFPIAYAAVSGAVLYDAERHFLFALPPLAILSAVPIATLIEHSSSRALAVTVTAALFVSMVVTGADMVQLHPYEYIFFNRIFGGGVSEAAKSFETDYWGLSYKEGVEWIAQNYRARDSDRKIRVASCSFPLSTEYFLPKDRFTYVGSYDYLKEVSDRPDLFLATTRWRCHETFSGHVLHVVARKGTPLLYVKEIDESESPRRPY